MTSDFLTNCYFCGYYCHGKHPHPYYFQDFKRVVLFVSCVTILSFSIFVLGYVGNFWCFEGSEPPKKIHCFEITFLFFSCIKISHHNEHPTHTQSSH
jgi:hypothetical protein